MWGGCREAGCEARGTAWEEIVWGTGAMCGCLVYYFRALRATMLFFGTSPLKKDKGQKTPAPSVGVALFPHTWCWEMREYPCSTSLLPGTWLQRRPTRRSQQLHVNATALREGIRGSDRNNVLVWSGNPLFRSGEARKRGGEAVMRTADRNCVTQQTEVGNPRPSLRMLVQLLLQIKIIECTTR